jgi:hypothetical protein
MELEIARLLVKGKSHEIWNNFSKYFAGEG